jgi:hypothetical protein
MRTELQGSDGGSAIVLEIRSTIRCITRCIIRKCVVFNVESTVVASEIQIL